MKTSPPSRRRRLPLHSIEPLEARIAPANVSLAAGTGPFTLEVSQTTNHLVILNGAMIPIFDQGTSVGDDLFVTGGGAADFFNIIDTAAGNVMFTGVLYLNVAGPINVSGTVMVGGVTNLATSAGISVAGTINGTQDVVLDAATGIGLNAGGVINCSGGTVVLHSDTDQNNDGPIFLNTGTAINVMGTGSIFLDGNGPGHPAYGDATKTAGVFLGGVLSTTNGNISIDAHGWDGGNGAQHGVGVEISGGTINTNGGSIFITGAGGNSAAAGNVGVLLSSGSIQSAGGGAFNVVGIGGGTGRGEMGVRLVGGSIHAGTVPLSVMGTGATTADGTAADNTGVSIESGSGITNEGTATISIQAQAGAASAALAMVGATVNRIGFDGVNAYAGGIAIALQEDPATGVDPLQLAPASGSIASTGTLQIAPVSDATTIGIAGGTGVLNVSTADLALFALAGFSSIGFNTLGAVGNNAMDVGAFDFGGPSVSFSVPGGGSITLEGAVTSTGGRVDLHPGAGSVHLKSGSFTETAGNQIDDGAAVTLDSGTMLDLNGHNERIGSLAGAGDVLLGGATLTVGAASGVVTTFSGRVMGNGGLTVRDGNMLVLTGQSTYAGGTLVDNTAFLTLGVNNALPTTTMLTVTDSDLNIGHFNQTVAGLTAGQATISGTGTITSGSTYNFGSTSCSAKLAGNVGVSVSTVGGATLGNKNNTFTGPVTVDPASNLHIGSDGALGDTANVLTVNSGATLHTSGTFATSRSIVANGANPSVDVVSGTFTINGTVTGTGTLTKTGTGTLLFGSSFTGTAMVAGGFVQVAATKVGIAGTGSVTVTIINDGMGGTRISTVELADTSAATVLAISGPKVGTTTIDTIKSLDPNDVVGTIKVGNNVIIGNGVNDAIADVDLRGQTVKLLLSDISAHTIFELGKGLAYLDTYTNHPDIKLRNILGEGVIIDATGDGTTPSGVGGGGLGKVIVQSWTDAGLVKTTQSITSFKFKTGDCNVVFEVDKFGLGLLTIAGMGSMSVPNGAWGSTGSVIEGMITTFTAAQFLQNANLTTGGTGTFKIKTGDFLGYVNSTDDMRNISIKGAMKGSIQAKSIGKITAEYFDGTTTGDTYGTSTRHNIVTTLGGIGTLTAKPHDLDAYGIRNYDIVIATSFGGLKITDLTAPGSFVGVDSVIVQAGSIGALSVTLTGAASIKSIQNSTFESNLTIGKITTSHTVTGSMFAAATDIDKIAIGGDLTLSHILAGTFLGDDALLGGMSTAADVFTKSAKIAGVTVTGAFSATTIAAGIDPGNTIYGDGDDTLSVNGVAPSGTTKAIGALVFGAGSGTGAAASLAHNYAIIANTIKSLTINGSPVTGFPKYLDLGSPGEDAGDVLVKTI